MWQGDGYLFLSECIKEKEGRQDGVMTGLCKYLCRFLEPGRKWSMKFKTLKD